MKEFGPRGEEAHVPCIPTDFFVTVTGLRGESLGCDQTLPIPYLRKNHPKLFNFMLQLSVNDTLHSKSIACHIANLLLKDSVKRC